jgi:hypothetical protein
MPGNYGRRHHPLSILAGIIAATIPVTVLWPGAAQTGPISAPDADMALVVAVDTSNSVDDRRYHLQVEGIAKALEDPGVINAITSGPQGGIFFSLVEWADRPQLDIPWVRISNANDANRVAGLVRALPRNPGNFTCMATMMRSVADKVVTQIPAKATRVVIDISGTAKTTATPKSPLKPYAMRSSATELRSTGCPSLKATRRQLWRHGIANTSWAA